MARASKQLPDVRTFATHFPNSVVFRTATAAAVSNTELQNF